jgi:hypothetical protein
MAVSAWRASRARARRLAREVVEREDRGAARGDREISGCISFTLTTSSASQASRAVTIMAPAAR